MNTTPYRMVIAIVGAAVLGALVIMGVLAVREQPIPDVLQQVEIAGITGLLGLLVQVKQPSEG